MHNIIIYKRVKHITFTREHTVGVPF